ncbi:MAG: toxin co-regulated pilus biosynthesis Q family protein [Thalassotalea sp.]|nr:toxin co-regulated pilus biosynthesis Q family protein [Thalassotalea sp.]
MNFWVRNGIFAIILAVAAYFLLANQELLVTLTGDVITSNDKEAATSAQGAAQQSSIDDTPLQPKASLKTSNKAAEGLSTFYANLRGMDEDDDGPKIRNGVVYLSEPKGDITKLLEAKAMVTRPLKSNWRGDIESRPFREGQTLLQKMIEYAEKDGLEIIWRLNKDLLVKNPFRINKDVLQTAYQVGIGINGHFPEGVDVYFCYKQRTIVFQSGPYEYLEKNCRLLTSEPPNNNARRY